MSCAADCGKDNGEGEGLVPCCKSHLLHQTCLLNLIKANEDGGFQCPKCHDATLSLIGKQFIEAYFYRVCRDAISKDLSLQEDSDESHDGESGGESVEYSDSLDAEMMQPEGQMIPPDGVPYVVGKEPSNRYEFHNCTFNFHQESGSLFDQLKAQQQ